MDLELILEGSAFKIYGMLVGEGVGAFLERLRQENPAEYARMDRRLTQLSERGASKHRDEFNSLGRGLFEMKSRGGTRIVFFYDAGHLVICTQGFAKKAQKMPRRELDMARARKADYERVRQQGGKFRIIVTE
ncbi:MAG: type II toxin-antitoxin system RelE/ParE family toxin [Patescibacteria group bacterium]